MSLAGTFTDLVLGTLQDVNQIFGQNQDIALIRTITSILGNEAEQDGFFRLIQKKNPSSQPYLTTASRDFAFTAIQSFTITGSCPNIGTIPLKTFRPLTVLSSDVSNSTQSIEFSFSKDSRDSFNISEFRLVYMNGQSNPIVKNMDNVQSSGDKISFEAAFPFEEYQMFGLTIAVVTRTANNLENITAVSNSTMFGPGIIQIT